MLPRCLVHTSKGHLTQCSVGFLLVHTCQEDRVWDRRFFTLCHHDDIKTVFCFVAFQTSEVLQYTAQSISSIAKGKSEMPGRTRTGRHWEILRLNPGIWRDGCGGSQPLLALNSPKIWISTLPLPVPLALPLTLSASSFFSPPLLRWILLLAWVSSNKSLLLFTQKAFSWDDHPSEVNCEALLPPSPLVPPDIGWILLESFELSHKRRRNYTADSKFGKAAQVPCQPHPLFTRTSGRSPFCIKFIITLLLALRSWGWDFQRNAANEINYPCVIAAISLSFISNKGQFYCLCSTL